MPRRKSAKKSASHKKLIPRDPYYVAPKFSDVLSRTQIPTLKSQVPQKVVFRFRFNAGVAVTTNFTTTMFLDMYCVATGGTTTPARLFNNMKLLSTTMWQGAADVSAGNVATTQISLEYSPGTAAGFGGAPRCPYESVTDTTAKYAYIRAVPKRNELASQWFSGIQTSYTILNMLAGTDCIVDFEFLVTYLNGETPIASNQGNSSAAKGTIGVTNFNIAGCRSMGLVDLISP